MATHRLQLQLSERAQYLFKCLVERYIEEGQPVGSRTLARGVNLDLSAATIRNVMADLEEMGLIRSPHTSAGRVPTVKGYRLFVDSMMTVRDISSEEVRRISADLGAAAEYKALAERASSILSEITRLASIVMLPRMEQQALRHVEFLPLSDNRVLAILVVNNQEVQNRIIQTQRLYSASELEQVANYLNQAFAGRDLEDVRRDLVDDLSDAREEMNRMMEAVVDVAQKALVPSRPDQEYIVAGHTHLMELDELAHIDKLRHLFEAFQQKRDILHLLDQALHASGVQIFIGEESGYRVLDDYSIVTSTYAADGRALGVVGVIGPTRMAYERVVPLVDLTARIIGATLKSRN